MTPTQRLVIAALVIGSFLIGGNLLAWSAVRSKTNRLNELLNEAEAMQRPVHNNQLPTLNAVLHDSIEAAFRKNVAAVYHDITQCLGDLRVKRQSITTAAANDNGAVSRVPLTVTFNGSFASAFALLDRVSHDDQIIRLQRLQIKREPGAALDALSVSMQLETFMRSSKEAP